MWRGAFTGARKGGQKGKFELADKGTIFLDEIGELPLYLQAKLLRVLESNEIQKIGMSGSKYSDFRLIAATNRNLPELVDKRQFREDLYHRLNILELSLPPLRKHRGDIPSLITQLIEGICGPQKALEIRISQDVLDLFMRYGWAGERAGTQECARLCVLLHGRRRGRTDAALSARAAFHGLSLGGCARS